MKNNTYSEYKGFEQGPIRPPSEANSLLIRVTRNCPWNRCAFCPVYKRSRFSLRPVEHVIKDIDAVHKHLTTLQNLADDGRRKGLVEIDTGRLNIVPDERQAFYAAYQWLACGMKSIFLQDANSLIIKPSDLIIILDHLKKCFPRTERITSYARSHTVARITDSDLFAIRAAGLNRIHIGLESGSDKVLELVKKGVSKETQVKAGQKAKKAGFELSEYVMPGLGGAGLSREHAIETADALNRINPDFIRLRTLAIPKNIGLYDEYIAGRFEKCTDLMMAREILLFIENLNGITSTIKSDHILNLFEDVEGELPRDKEKITGVLSSFLDMPQEEQIKYQIGRRLGIFSRLADMKDPKRIENAENMCIRFGITPGNVDKIVDELMQRFV
ncbi:MAG: radical SAM protein [Desulfobacteraceae bacterium]|nr:MAG: radical SAM protein [Desulfobacteraceae bacterium]